MKKTNSELYTPRTEKIKIEDLKVDGLNTNKMTDKQMKGLRESMRKWGFLQPIVIDQDNIIIAGEHRLRVYQEFNVKEIECKRIHVDETQRRLLRQVMNRLHGEPEKEKDAMDLQFISGDEMGSVLLEEILDIKDADIEEMTKFMGDAHIEPDPELQPDKKRRIVLFFTSQDFPKYRKKFDQLMDAMNVTTETEVVKNLVDSAVNIE
jgi:hypothetical protein